MAEGSLSQNEIDELLNAAQSDDSSGAGDDPFASLLAGAGEGGTTSSDLAELDSLLGGGGGGGGPSSDAIMAALGPTPAPSKPATGGGGRSGVGGTNSNLNLLMDVTMSLTVELGRTLRYIKDVLQLTEGAIVELDKNVGEELDILVNGKLIGHGKLIVLDDYYGIQITHIIDPMERLKLA
ncbi:MAG: flagellar motor switch protein FliN [Leptospiraceae bacterium]|nr:flagellar motor switch protein FliN [Leptospiraceae bacterium]